VNPRRLFLLQGLAAPALADVRRGVALQFPRDHGAHLAQRTEWWYATGWLGEPAAPTHGFQITFFRSRTGLAEDNPSRFAARQLLFAHAAVLALGARKHTHDQRLVRWAGDAEAERGRARLDGGGVQIGTWSLQDEGASWRARADAEDFSLDLALTRTQPLLLQGDAGFSRKGPDEAQASHYYSEPQLAAQGRVVVQGRAQRAAGRAWLDHEWSDEMLHPQAQGWDWLGINLFDGSALTVFRLRRRDGGVLWAGGSFRAPGQPPRSFGPQDVLMTPGRTWRSPQSGASYPLQWQLQTPAGRFALNALFDAQELDSRASTGAIYWEGLAELLDGAGRRAGLGYLELTGYAAPIKLR
jgi:predicted secreted hydrolase